MKLKSLFCFFILLNVVILNTDFLACAGATQLTSEGIVFPDGTKQTTKAVETGIPGPKGDTGDTGPQGPKGDDGFVSAICPVQKTGQTKCYDEDGNLISCTGTGQDGNLQRGFSWPIPRFTDNEDGTVRDNLTGLIWLKNADCNGIMTWKDALSWASSLYDGCTACGGTDNDCGLSDSSISGEWRLPNVNELLTLIDWSQSHPALPSGHPFANVPHNYYWTSTSVVFIHNVINNCAYKKIVLAWLPERREPCENYKYKMLT